MVHLHFLSMTYFLKSWLRNNAFSIRSCPLSYRQKWYKLIG